MFKRFISIVIIFMMSLVLFAGCSSTVEENKEFEAVTFVNDCRIFTPASQYKTYDSGEFALIFTRNVFEEFVKSEYYSNMSEDERINAFNELGSVLETYSYGSINGGFIDSFTVNVDKHMITWHNVGLDYEIEWAIPKV